MKYKFTRKQRKLLIRAIVSAGVFAAAFSLLLIPALTVWVPRALFLVSYITVGYDILKKAALGIVRGRVLDENFLMATASIGAIALFEFPEAAAVMLLYQIGELFQSVAVGKSRKSVAALTEIRPDTANLVTEGGVETVDPEDVPVGSLVAVYPGERVPLDGIIEEGNTAFDSSALTGESIPTEGHPGDQAVSGCINVTGAIKIRTTKEFGDSTVTRILELVEESGNRKSKQEAFITRFAKYYTPVVCALALALAVVPPLAVLLTGGGNVFADWIKRAFTFLVISCPCALVISIPMTFFSGIGCASKNGILVKGSNFLEAVAGMKTLVSDKTGTLTEGRFAVTSVIPTGELDEETILRYAAGAESVTTHPIGASIRAACADLPDPASVRDIEEIPGEGVRAVVSGRRIFVGKVPDGHIVPSVTGVTVAVTVDGETVGYITASDSVKSDAPDAIRALAALGVTRSFILTGDREESARAVAEAVGIGGVRAGLLPGDKVAELEKIMKESDGVTCYVGDGINDAPVLARADVGFAMGAMGSDAAIEAADVVLMDDSVMRLPLAVKIAKKTVRIAKENIAFSIAVKGACLLLGALGAVGMPVAIFADVGVMILAVLNAARALGVNNKNCYRAK